MWFVKSWLYITNEPKSVWDPVEEITWVGYNINNENNTIQAEEQRICKLTSALANVLQTNDEYMNLKTSPSIVGQIISLEIAISLG